MSAQTERLALLFSDGSMNVLGPEATFATARRDRDFSTDGSVSVDIVRVTVSVQDTVEPWSLGEWKKRRGDVPA